MDYKITKAGGYFSIIDKNEGVKLTNVAMNAFTRGEVKKTLSEVKADFSKGLITTEEYKAYIEGL